MENLKQDTVNIDRWKKWWENAFRYQEQAANSLKIGPNFWKYLRVLTASFYSNTSIQQLMFQLQILLQLKLLKVEITVLGNMVYWTFHYFFYGHSLKSYHTNGELTNSSAKRHNKNSYSKLKKKKERKKYPNKIPLKPVSNTKIHFLIFHWNKNCFQTHKNGGL